MRRLARHAFTALSVLSLLLCVAVCVLWVRSEWRWDAVTRLQRTATATRVLAWYSNESCMGFNWGELTPYSPTEPALIWMRTSQPARGTPGPATWKRYTWEYLQTVNAPHVIHYLAIHDAWFAAATMILPTAWAMRWRRRRRRIRDNHCIECGYDLRASPGRCPECGASVRKGREADANTA